ncbi:MAG: TonB-dependent receptor, partial [Gammaproteobacteria bacterium]|nr:TonB-dependent receptor [Gammaproteobacteria bacterium]
MRYRTITLTAFAVSLAMPGSYSFAAEERAAIEEVVVTARKREEDMQSVAVAVSVFDSESMRVNSITGLEDIAQRTPSFVWSETGAANPHLFIRGIGTEGPSTYAGGDPSVVVMVDGVYIGRISGANTDLFDLERVEVLRGPQGTVYGKNAVGGVVNVISKRPSSEPEVQVEASLGNLDRMNLKGYVSGPLSDTVAAKLAVSSLNRDGFVKNEETGSDLWDEDSTSIRAGLLFTPNDELEAMLTVESIRERESGAPRDIIEDGTFNGGVHAITNPDPRVVNAPMDSFFDRDILGLTLQVDYEMEIGNLTSITAYRDTEAEWRHPFFGNPVTATTIESTSDNIEDFTQFSEELRLASHAGDGALDWAVGVYYFSADIDRIVNLNQEFAAFLPFLGGILEYDQTIKTESWAVFGEIDYQLTDQLQLNIGARYTTE